jgi:hypothetical protein
VGDPAARVAELVHPDPEVERGAVGLVDVAEHGRQLVAQHSAQRQRVHLDHGGGGAGLAGGGGGFEADPAGADDQHLEALAQVLPQPVGLLDRAQVADAVAVGPGHVELPGARPGREQQLVVAQWIDVVHRDRVPGRVQPGHGDAEDQLDVVLPVPLGLVDERLVARLLAEQVTLGQGRTFVRRSVSAPISTTLPGEAVLAQLLRGLRARHRGAHDQECTVVSHTPQPMPPC